MSKNEFKSVLLNMICTAKLIIINIYNVFVFEFDSQKNTKNLERMTNLNTQLQVSLNRMHEKLP
jgi:hypothetical protein